MVAIVGLVRIDSIALTAERAAAAADRGEWSEAAHLALSVVEADPDLPAYAFLAGLATARGPDPTAQLTALTLLRRSAEADDLPQAWMNVAAIELELGNANAAKETLERALRLGWQQPAVTVPAATLYLRLGDRSAALEALADAFAVAPELVDDPFWGADPDLSELRDTAVEQAIAARSPVAFQLALQLGRLDDARAAAVALPQDEREIASLVVAAWSGDGSARVDLVRLAEERPLDMRAVIWSATLAGRDGDEEAQGRFRSWAAIVGGSLGGALGEDIVVTDLPKVRSQVPGADAEFHGLYTYRRSYPWDLLVPRLPKLTKE
jgi:tetratricopeptide (TPR) repeat protein